MHQDTTTMPEKIWYTYDDIHRAICTLAGKIQASPDTYHAMIAIGGGGFIPARILRSYLNIPIYAISTAYYQDDFSSATREEIRKIQWLDPLPDSLVGKNVLLVDEVDDSRTTLAFCVSELQKTALGRIGIAVLHEKIKPKAGRLPADIPFFSGLVTEDLWINYPWDAEDIDAYNTCCTPRR